MPSQDGKPRYSKVKTVHEPVSIGSSSETQRNPVFPSDMAAEGTMPGGFMGPQRAPSPQRGAAPPLQHLGNIPESRKPGTPCGTGAASAKRHRPRSPHAERGQLGTSQHNRAQMVVAAIFEIMAGLTPYVHVYTYIYIEICMYFCIYTYSFSYMYTHICI